MIYKIAMNELRCRCVVPLDATLIAGPRHRHDGAFAYRLLAWSYSQLAHADAHLQRSADRTRSGFGFAQPNPIARLKIPAHDVTPWIVAQGFYEHEFVAMRFVPARESPVDR